MIYIVEHFTTGEAPLLSASPKAPWVGATMTFTDRGQHRIIECAESIRDTYVVLLEPIEHEPPRPACVIKEMS